MAQDVIVRIQGLNKTFRGRAGTVVALNGIDLDIYRGEIFGIIGLSGAGKSTLVRCINFLEKPTEGTVTVDGQELGKLSKKQLLEARRSMGMIFQQFNLLQQRTALQNICFPLEIAGTSKADAEKRARELLEIVGLSDRADNYPSQLSGGQQQRVAIARAIVNEPKLLLLDEPLGALDLKLRQDMQYELIRLKNELGITFIYVTHDQEEALTMSDTIVVMNQGYIQQIGSPEKIYNEPENAFVADFIGDSNIISSTMVRDKLVHVLGVDFSCVDTGFGENKPVDVVIRPEDVELVSPGDGIIRGVVSHLIFKGVHYEMEVQANGFEWLVHSTTMFPVGTEVGIRVAPFNIQIMNKPASEDEEAVGVNE